MCTAGDACHVAGTCDTGTGSCSDPAAPNGSACNDLDACTHTDTCQSGTCTGSNPVVCVPSDSCHLAGTCDTGTGSCSNPAVADGTACDDGNACTSADECTGAVCGGTPVPPPGLVDGVRLAQGSGTTSISWDPLPGATTSDVVRGLLSGFPVGPGGGDEDCFDNLSGTSTNDPADPISGDGYWYLVRGESACGVGAWGYEGLYGVPAAPRVTTTCP